MHEFRQRQFSTQLLGADTNALPCVGHAAPSRVNTPQEFRRQRREKPVEARQQAGKAAPLLLLGTRKQRDRSDHALVAT